MMPLPHLVESESAGEPASPAVILRGTNAGLEIVVDGDASVEQIGTSLLARLEQSPGFFAGNDVCVRVEGRLPPGALARLEEVTSRFDIRIVEVGPPRRPATAPAAPPEPQPEPPAHEHALEHDPPATATSAQAVAPAPLPSTPDPAPEPSPVGPRLLVGPVRSGVILHVPTDLVILGDVNPGAEIHARGNIIVLGRLRGMAHAAVGTDKGFIIALRFEPQQLRIGTLVARAGDADSPGQGAEIAYATGRTIVVERFHGKLPSGL